MVKTHIDRVDSRGVEGWAVSEHRNAIRVDVLLGDEVIASGEPSLVREDVGIAMKQIGNSLHAGFRVMFPRPLDDQRVRCAITVRASELDAAGALVDSITVADSLLGGGDAALAPAPWADRAPFPRAVADILHTYWPNDFSSETVNDRSLQDLAVNRIAHLLSRSNPGRFRGLIRYLRFLRACWSHFDFVEQRFATFNTMSSPGAKDWLIRATHKREIISIANHLYCLKSLGRSGDFAEFGCFKGFSSSMLSYACSLLDIRMHIFDSFAGLPQSASTHYAAGEFAGSLQEVQQNVELFGASNVVTVEPLAETSVALTAGQTHCGYSCDL